ncbi:MAG: hypothetical protein GX950_03015 [Candidatus Diapherotrites archaeon]|uniref:Uncharacterized protein n=1 Tax=Candidatus Iainarchaeum sp. TaxID=3101447 RepID=A0A7K4BZX2_9ARCH|nr:hypothetical protein [Candidatus Diapherotrites archaeon]
MISLGFKNRAGRVVVKPQRGVVGKNKIAERARLANNARVANASKGRGNPAFASMMRTNPRKLNVQRTPSRTPAKKGFIARIFGRK